MTAKHSKVGRLALDGPATVREAEAMHAKLAALLPAHGEIEVDCSAVSEADLSLVQLLLAARRSAGREGKRLVLAAPAEGALLEALTQGGLLAEVRGEAGPDQAFWTKGRDA
ncbi:ABC-type transporter Mla maintaining outer membrane lipid asymmetry, MlaB component, contains STAS domain [Tistlia consotensis]|uniref:ABC-type transporter Mla maintaining outer membrane lipid asymmetry, MlaB component, contains STAS domain n=1 Tax=Tistlia consotensis USBA 355 TaxID=560819 RepID=A0A1Y6CLQ9_9PROT|nr:STAS domain-containing protein [Tistlia consotensis]SMF75349.1 ABC-type transporter Mla maintaining outer membrane lipid asymmetry, MlaB component, contains STAS domain [Tistlia consotensis USBA 355]SNS08383.1 ABC-type transporter Mla maintaining outer membrane lipid asymmetry, MlaB component, contains STAS domain [Tistlia consotensis]